MYVSFWENSNGKRVDVQSILNMWENEMIMGKDTSPFILKLEIR